MRTLAIIPCFNNGGGDLIHRCVGALNRWMPSMDIAIVDSDSPDKSYFDEIKNCMIIDEKNKNYDVGGYNIGFKNHRDYDFYLCIHDSFILNDTIKKFHSGFTPFRTFETGYFIGGRHLIRGRKDALFHLFSGKARRSQLDLFGFDNSQQVEFVQEASEILGISDASFWTGVFGPIFVADNSTLAMLSQHLFDLILPSNKNQQMAYERLLGLFIDKKNIKFNKTYGDNHYKTNLLNKKYHKIISLRK